MKWIVDASVAMKWIVDEEGSTLAASLAAEDLAAPELMLSECANALWAKVRRGELERNEARERMRLLGTAPLRLDRTPELIDVALDLALTLKHPVYDCLYLALSIKEAAPVVTADRRFRDAVRRDKDFATLIVLLDELGSP